MRRGLCLALVALLASAWAGPARAAEGSFDSGPELGQRLLRNVVRIRAADFGEHGFGLVVAARPRELLVATARHVVVPAEGAAPPDFDPARRRIEVGFCAGEAGGGPAQPAQLEPGFDAAGHDVALLRVPRPPGYEPLTEVLAAPATLELRQEAWLLGQEQQCGVAPRSGALAALADARGQLRLEFPGIRGGASGGPALTGYGFIGLLTDADDLTVTVLSAELLARLLRAYSGTAWGLAEGRNIPPGDPRAAEVDLAETLNQYLFSARDLQGLLLQPFIPKPRFVAFAEAYNKAISQRFARARERYDGTLRRYWPEPVFAQWQALRERLWAIHEAFRALNTGESQLIFDQQSAPPAVQERMRALEPELQRLQSGIAEFLLALGQRSQS